MNREKVPLALIPKESAPPANVNKDPVPMNAGLFSPIQKMASPKNITMPSIRLIFTSVLGELLGVGHGKLVRIDKAGRITLSYPVFRTTSVTRE